VDGQRGSEHVGHFVILAPFCCNSTIIGYFVDQHQVHTQRLTVILQIHFDLPENGRCEVVINVHGQDENIPPNSRIVTTLGWFYGMSGC